MAPPAKLPPVDVLVRLRRKHRTDADHPGTCREGHTQAEIGQIYGTSPAAVYQKLRDAGMAGDLSYLPWKLAPGHNQEWTAHMLRELAKRQRGLKAGYRAGPKGQWLDKWLEGLGTRHVIDYTPEAGFIKVRRRKADGDGYVRQPEKHPRRTRSATG